MKPSIIAALLILLGLLAATLFFTNIAENLWLVTTGRGFDIPAESSLLRFKVTKMNQGSGEWWLYAEDSKNYYAMDSSDRGYRTLSKNETIANPDFDPLDLTTWPTE